MNELWFFCAEPVLWLGEKCWVAPVEFVTLWKNFPAAFMLAEILWSLFTCGGDPSELCSHICHVAIFNPCQELTPLKSEYM